MAPPREIRYPNVPAVFGGGRVLPSPSQFYLTGEDRLRVVSGCSVTGVSHKVQVRTAREDGTIQAHSFNHVPNTDRTVRREDFDIGLGSVLNVTVFAGSGTPLIGQAYIMVQLVRGAGAAAIVLGTLLGGYVTATQALGFPGSPINDSVSGPGVARTINGTIPTQPNSLSETCPTGARWELFALNAHLATSAIASNRTVELRFIIDGGQPYVGFNPRIQTASESVYHIWSIGATVADLLTINGRRNSLPLAHFLLMKGGDLFVVGVNGLQPGDAFDVFQYFVREWLEV